MASPFNCLCMHAHPLGAYTQSMPRPRCTLMLQNFGAPEIRARKQQQLGTRHRENGCRWSYPNVRGGFRGNIYWLFGTLCLGELRRSERRDKSARIQQFGGSSNSHSGCLLLVYHCVLCDALQLFLIFLKSLFVNAFVRTLCLIFRHPLSLVEERFMHAYFVEEPETEINISLMRH